MIIGINGYAGSGKDTAGALIQYIVGNVGKSNLEAITDNYEEHEWWLEESSGWEIKKWAGKLKTIASILTGIPKEKFEDQEFKKTYLHPEWNKPYAYIPPGDDRPVNKEEAVKMSVREFLQRLGTDGLREGLHPNTWVNALMSDYIGMYDLDTDRTVWPNWIITDTRFPNEAQAIKDADGIVIRIDRPGVTAINAHPSETGLDNWDFDYRINNNGDRFALMQQLYEILEKKNLL